MVWSVCATAQSFDEAVVSEQVSSDSAASHEPLDFKLPEKLLEFHPFEPPNQLDAPVPTPSGEETRSFIPPWTEEMEFGNSAPIDSMAKGSIDALNGASVNEYQVDGPTLESGLQGGTMNMLSSLPVVAGRLEGIASVSSTGAATYSIPLWTPPGARGLEPNLALVYSSDTEDALMGPGWSLSGLSTIARCPKTTVEDGVRAQIALTTADTFCLDGNKLRLTGGSYGVAGSTYQTQIEIYSKVTANGTTGNGPTWFEVRGKDGLIYEYGNTSNSRVTGVGGTTPYLWALNKVRDRQGNNLTISYTLSDGSFRPNVISYTQTVTDSTYHYTVTFGYQPRSQIATVDKWLPGTEIRDTQALTTITVAHDGATVRQYNLDYSTSSVTQRLRVSAVQACTTTDCLSPTIIAYQSGQASIAAPTTSTGSGATSGLVSTVDVDGDGRDDLVYATASGSNRTWYVRFATSGGFGAATATGLVTSSSTAVLFDDLLGNGRTCLLGLQSSTWYADCWTGSSFTHLPAGVNLAAGLTGAAGQYVLADTDGNGKSDLLRTDLAHKIYIRLNNSSGSAVSFATTETVALDTATSTEWPNTNILSLQGNNSVRDSSVHRVDFNGDGADDIVAYMQHPSWLSPGGYVLAASGNMLTWRSTYDGLGTSTSTPINFNNDNCTDFINTFVAPSISDSILVSPCGGTNTYFQTGIHHGPMSDYDGDGRTDVWYASGGSWQVILSEGDTTLGTAINTELSVGSGPYQVFDQNGDGLDDLAYIDPLASNAVKYGLHNGSGAKPDLATSFTDGYGMNASFTYVSMTAATGGCYTRDVPAGPANSKAFIEPLYVACQMTASNGISNDPVAGVYHVNYAYYNANIDLQGRGFLGFGRRYATDDRNGVVDMQSYSQTFPSIGWVTEKLIRQPGGVTNMRSSTYTIASTSYGSGSTARQFPYVSQSIDDDYEVGGTLNGQLITRTTMNMTPDTYGTPTTTTVAVKDMSTASFDYNSTYTVQTVNTIPTNDTTNWCLGKPTQTTVTSTLPGGASATRTTAATVDYSNCRNTTETVEPGSSTLQVTTTYGFDTCGNINSTSVVGKNPDGTNMAARATSYNYGYLTSRCAFPERITNALSQQTDTAYNYTFGAPSTITDPNGLVTAYTYDGYGRPKRETRPDQTYSQNDYLICDSANNYCGVQVLRSYVFRKEYTPTDSEITYRIWLRDGFDRTVYDQRRDMASGLTMETAFYDPLGRQSTYHVPRVSATNGYHLYSYDLLNRLTLERLFTAAGTLDRQQSMLYKGRRTEITDFLSNTTAKVSDVRGKLRQVIDPSPGGTTSFGYDPFGALSSTTDAIGVATSATFDPYGRRLSLTDPDRGNWTFQSDSLGELINARDAKTAAPGWTRTNEYDLLGRLKKRTEAEGVSNWTWGNLASAKNIGRLAGLSGPGYSESYAFDSVGRLSQTTYNADASYVVNYTYNASTGFLDNVAYPTSTSGYRLRVQYLYSHEYLTSVRDYNAPSTVWWQRTAEDVRGNPTEETLANGVHVKSTFDLLTGSLNLRTSGETGPAYTNQQNLSYTWDDNQNLSDRIDLNQSNLTEHFTYDALDRIDLGKRNGVTNLDMAIDASGNVTSRADNGGAAQTFSYATQATCTAPNTSNPPHGVRKVGSSAIYCYDANGNMTKRDATTIGWTSYNLPSTITQGSLYSNFSYTPDRRYWKQEANYTDGLSTTIYVGDLLEKVTSSVSGVTQYRHMIRAGSTLILVSRSSDGTNQTYYAAMDHLGSTTVVSDSSGGYVAKESYSAYGTRRAINWTGSPPSAQAWADIAATTRRGFTGHTMLDNLNLIHMNGRLYDPVTGRFTSPDPFLDLGAGTQGLNPYAYVSNRILSFIDPSGYDLCTPGSANYPACLDKPRYDLPVIGKEFPWWAQLGDAWAVAFGGMDLGWLEPYFQLGETIGEVVVAATKREKQNCKLELSFDFNQFGNQIEENRFDLGATLGTLFAAEAAGTMPKTPGELRGLGVPKTELNPMTSQLSRWSSRFGIRALRELGRTAGGVAIGTAATLGIVFEGFYDWGVIGKSAWDATSSKCSP